MCFDSVVKPVSEVCWLEHVGGSGLAGLVRYRRALMSGSEVFAEYGPGCVCCGLCEGGPRCLTPGFFGSSVGGTGSWVS